jgi:hypothetical protein
MEHDPVPPEPPGTNVAVQAPAPTVTVAVSPEKLSASPPPVATLTVKDVASSSPKATVAGTATSVVVVESVMTLMSG